MRKKKYCPRLARLEKRVEELERRLGGQETSMTQADKPMGVSTAQLLNEWLNGEERREDGV